MASQALLDRRLLFITGKGGVGKSTIAASLALLAAQEGKRTLICEVDAKGNLSDFYGTAPLRFEPTEVNERLFAMAMDTEESLREYLRLNLRVPLISRLGPYEVRERNYDLVVVDASATGHVVGQLAAPVAMKELISVGLIRQQTEWMLDLLTDPAVTGVVVVATPEEMPVNETLELIERLDSETDTKLAAVVANRVLPELFGRGEEAAFDLLDADSGRAALAAVAGPKSAAVVDAARLAVELRRSRAVHLKRLAEGLPSDAPLINVPYLFTKSHGMRTTRQVADRLGEDLL